MAERRSHIYIMGQQNFDLAVVVGNSFPKKRRVAVREITRRQDASGMVFVSATIRGSRKAMGPFWEKLRETQDQLPPPQLLPVKPQTPEEVFID